MQKLLRNADIVWRVEKRRESEALAALAEGVDIAEQGTVILIHAGSMHQLNLVGGMIWRLCDGSRSADELVDALLPEFDVEREELALDVNEFVDDLLARGWLAHG